MTNMILNFDSIFTKYYIYSCKVILSLIERIQRVELFYWTYHGNLYVKSIQSYQNKKLVKWIFLNRHVRFRCCAKMVLHHYFSSFSIGQSFSLQYPQFSSPLCRPAWSIFVEHHNLLLISLSEVHPEYRLFR